ncbi:MAG: hypothetical protein ACWA45_08400 [Flavobacteriales bacterium]
MFEHIKAEDFGTYLGSFLTEEKAIQYGFKQLNAEDLLKKISNKIIFGDYPMGFTFVTKIENDGNLKGLNNVGFKDEGTWFIDNKNNTLHLQWNRAWANTITRAYEVNNNIEFFDIETGNWRTTFRF